MIAENPQCTGREPAEGTSRAPETIQRPFGLPVEGGQPGPPVAADDPAKGRVSVSRPRSFGRAVT